jgi:formylglycine-generating enzyme required for sulfatase activity
MFNVKLLKLVSAAAVFFFAWFAIAADFTMASNYNGRTNGLEPGMEDVRQEKGKTLAMEPAPGKDKESEYRPQIIEKPGKKKKLRWWHLVIGVVVVGGIVTYVKISQYRRCHYDTKVLDFEWAKIPAGEFTMGTDSSEGEADETPEHTVYLDEYEISKYEVTFAQYDKFCDDTGRAKPGDNGWQRGKNPVIDVTWEDAKAFCDWLSRKSTCYRFALPTEAQWEKAARGTDKRKYPWGNEPPTVNLVNYNKPNGPIVEVGHYPAGVSPYGVYDMAGNVWEWCSDWYDGKYYEEPGNSNPQGPPTGTTRVTRGGGYSSNANDIRTTERSSHNPTSFKANYLGFRICRYKD